MREKRRSRRGKKNANHNTTTLVGNWKKKGAFRAPLCGASRARASLPIVLSRSTLRMQDAVDEGGLPLAAAWEVRNVTEKEPDRRRRSLKPMAIGFFFFFSLPLTAAYLALSFQFTHIHDTQDVKHTRITGLAALEDAQSALAALDALVGGGGDKRTGGGDLRRHPAVLRLLSQCPFPQLASYVASGEARGSSSSARRKASSGENGSCYCFPPAGGKSARGAAAADRRLSEAALVLSSGAEAAERAARAAGDLASLPEEEVEALLAEEAGLGFGSGAAAAAAAVEVGEGGERGGGGGGGGGGAGGGDEAESRSPAADAAASRLRGLSLASAAPVSLAAVADALELLAKMRRAVASGEEEKKKKEKKQEEEGRGTTAASSSSQPPPPSRPLPPAACPWSSLDHLHSYALFWELAPFVDERDVEVALAVERAARRKRRRKKEEESGEEKTK